VEVTTGMPENDSLSVRTTDQREGQIPVPLWYPEVLTKSEGSMGTAGGTAGMNIKTGALESDISSRSSVHSTSRQRAGTIPTPRPALRIPKRDKKLVETPGDTTSMKARIGTRENSVSSVRSARENEREKVNNAKEAAELLKAAEQEQKKKATRMTTQAEWRQNQMQHAETQERILKEQQNSM